MKITALLLTLSSLFVSGSSKVHKHHSHKEYPARVLPKMDEWKHFTSALPEDTKDGMHSFRQIRSLFFDKNLGYAEIKNLFGQMDINKGNSQN
mgnify:CR=1 FL=1